jgi:hypothetical protein
MGKVPLKWVVTGNFTGDGSVAWLQAGGEFSHHLKDAQLFETKDAAEAARQIVLGAERIVSDPYLTEVGIAQQGLDALSARERIREQGPSVRVRRPDPSVGSR